MAGDERPFHLGQNVLVEYKDGGWYPAEIVALIPSGYTVEWFDGSGRGRATNDQVRSITPTSHRFAIGEEILYEYEPARWATYKVVGLVDVGYVVQWQADEIVKILGEDALPFEPGKNLVPGASVLAHYAEDGTWYGGVLVAEFGDEVEVRWDEGGEKVRTGRAEVVDLQAISAVGDDAMQQGPTADRGEDAIVGGATKHLEIYLTSRYQTKEIEQGHTDRQFCPACRSHHEVVLVLDKSNETQFWLCNDSGHPKFVVHTQGSGLSVLPVEEFITRYPAIAKPKASLFARLVASSQVEVSLAPPFLALKISKRR